MYTFDSSITEDVLVIRLSDPELIEDNANRNLGAALLEQVDQVKNGKFLLDCAVVNFMTSSMVGQVVMLQKRCQAKNIALKLCRLSPAVHDIFETLRINTLIEIHADHVAALDAFGKSASSTNIADESVDINSLQEAANNGDRNAQFELGQAFEAGRSVDQDFDQALIWYNKAGSQGHTESQYVLGMWHAFGIHLQPNYDEALRWYSKAAEQGHAGAQFIMGMSHSFGLAVPQDHGMAFQWYRRAAEIGDADAQRQLAVSYFEGNGVSQDSTQAVKWFIKASQQGLADAQFALGSCYLHGEGIEKDREQAIDWYRAAAQQGHQDAQVTLDRIDSH